MNQNYPLGIENDKGPWSDSNIPTFEVESEGECKYCDSNGKLNIEDLCKSCFEENHDNN